MVSNSIVREITALVASKSYFVGHITSRCFHHKIYGGPLCNVSFSRNRASQQAITWGAIHDRYKIIAMHSLVPEPTAEYPSIPRMPKLNNTYSALGPPCPSVSEIQATGNVRIPPSSHRLSPPPSRSVLGNNARFLFRRCTS